MDDGTKKIVILIGTLILPVGVVAIWKEASERRPLLAALLLLVYAIFVFLVKVWSRMELILVQGTADSVLDAVRGFAPGVSPPVLRSTTLPTDPRDRRQAP